MLLLIVLKGLTPWMSIFGEAKAAIFAVSLSSYFGSFPLILEGDSLVVITAIENPSLIAD
jgi:hypothetical protein